MDSKSRLMKHRDKVLIILGSLVLLILLMLFSIPSGSVKFSLGKIFQYFTSPDSRDYGYNIIMNVRLPRILNAVFVGMNLGAAGALLQGILRNPMASPNIIGVNSGAGFAAVLVMVILPKYYSLIPVAAFFGALFASVIIFLLANRKGTYNTTVFLVLAGVAVSNLLKACTSGIMALNYEILEITYSWLLGSLSGRTWIELSSLLPYSVLGLIAAIFISPKVNLFALGDELSTSVGLKTSKYRIIIIIISSVLAGSAVSVAGTIGFVGLIAPHVARLIIGVDHRYMIPLSSICAAILLLAADTIARTAFLPIELNVGILTSLLGGPFFLYLLRKKSRLL